jgi:hypothetical protein
MKTITVKNFNFVEKNNGFWISGLELCRKLGYEYPKSQATKIWNRHEKHLKDFSVVAKLASTDSKNYETRIYNEVGSRFFISKCHKPLADKITIEMIEAFIKLRDEKSNKTESRNRGKLLNRSLTDQIQLLKEDETSNAIDFIYQNIAKLNCKMVTGLNPNQLREQRGVKSTRDGLSLEESVKLATLEHYQSQYLKDKALTPKEAYQDLKTFSGRFFEALQRIE